MNAKAVATLALFALPAVIVVACQNLRSGYDVDIRNMADQPVTARIVSPHPDGAVHVLSETRLGPGDRGSLFTQQESSIPLQVEVDFAGNVGHPAAMDLQRGRTIVNVKRTDEGSRGRLKLEEVPRP